MTKNCSNPLSYIRMSLEYRLLVPQANVIECALKHLWHIATLLTVHFELRVPQTDGYPVTHVLMVSSI